MNVTMWCMSLGIKTILCNHYVLVVGQFPLLSPPPMQWHRRGGGAIQARPIRLSIVPGIAKLG